jgi:hypothetical protein
MKSLLLCLSCLLVASLVACNMPASATPPAPPQMQTSAAQTIQAVLEGTPLSTPLASQVPQYTATPQIIQATISPTLVVKEQPKLTVEDVTNCRSGPGTGYDRIAQIAAGQQVRIVGSYPGYYLVQTEQGTCWVAMEFATPSGDMAGIPTVTAPPTVQGSTLRPPVIDRWTYACTGNGRADLTVQWTDRSTSESGYRIYMNGQVLVELPADSNSFSSSVLISAGGTANIYIEAFSTSGSATSSTFNFSC